jgi:4a-hydroxytetrahydrobiopterin dehydratase
MVNKISALLSLPKQGAWTIASLGIWAIGLPTLVLANEAIAVPLSGRSAMPLASAPTVLKQAELRQRLRQLPGWKTDGKHLICTAQFRDFVTAIAFVNRLVEPAEQAAHHPDLFIAFNKVTISLTTHDAGGITSLDTDLGAQISQLKDFPGCRRTFTQSGNFQQLNHPPFLALSRQVQPEPRFTRGYQSW